MKKTLIKSRNDIGICLFIIITTLIVYSQGINCDYICFDDGLYVTDNPHVLSGITLENFRWSFRFTNEFNTHYHPLTWLTHMIDCELFGLNPGMHHLVSIILHIINSLLLFFVVKLMTGKLWRSAFVASLFALHPINVESVAWVAERKNVLSTFFWILTMLAYYFYVKRPTLSRYLLIFLIFFMGLLSKSMVVTLPFALLLLDYWPLSRFRYLNLSGNSISQSIKSFIKLNSRLVIEKIPLMVISTILIYISFTTLHNVKISLELVNVKLRLANAVVSYLSYLGKMLWPRNLVVFYPYPEMVATAEVLGVGLILLSISFLVIRGIHRTPYYAIGWFWYLGTLMPAIGLVQVGLWPAMADRFVYIPQIGIFIIFSWGISDLLLKWHFQKKIIHIIVMVLLLILMVVSSVQVRYWKNSDTLFKHTIDVNFNNFVAHFNLGLYFYNQQKYSDSIFHYKEAVRIKPDFTGAHDNLGTTLLENGMVTEAIEYFKKAININKNYSKAHNNLGLAFLRNGNIAKAINSFQNATIIKPNYIDAHRNLRRSIHDQRNIETAVTNMQEAIKIKPEEPSLEKKLENLTYCKKVLNKTINRYQKALSTQPGFKLIDENNIDNVRSLMIEYEKSLLVFKQIVEFQPNIADAYYHIACIYARQNNQEVAIEWLRKAIEKGFNEWDLLKIDEDLSLIRDSFLN